MADFGGLLNFDPNDPKQMGLLTLGLGILAGNNGNRGAGAGLLLGMNQYQRALQNAAENKLREEQLQMQREEFGWKKSQNEREANEPYKVGNTLVDRNTLKPLFEASSANTTDPYYSPYDASTGTLRFNHRTGMFEKPDGTPVTDNIVKAANSPDIRGAVKGAEAQATANWKPNDMIEGQVLTDAQVAQMARGGLPNFNTPYPVTFGAPGTTSTDILEGTASEGSLGVRSPSNPNIGIRVPTDAEKAAQKKIMEDQADFNSTENVRKRKQSSEFKRISGNVVLEGIDNVLNRVDNFTSGLGGKVLGGIPGTEAYDLKSDIETIKANFGFDRLQAMRDMSPTGGALGQVAVQELTALQASVANLDQAQSPTQLKNNLLKAKKHYQNWLSTINSEGRENIIPQGQQMTNAQPLPAKPSALTLKKGVIYQTPKGALRWNGTAFED